MPDTDFRALWKQSTVVLLGGLVAVVLCYLWVDRPVAFYVHDHGINSREVFRWLTLPPPWLQTWSPALLAVLAVRRAWGPWTVAERALFVSLLSVIVADEFRTSLGDLCGRYWPETWFHDNPSLIGTGTYGFHPFVHGDDVGSFPSGHAARIVGFAAVWWIAMPAGRWLCAVASFPMLASLVAMNYHFVGDVIAGSVLGAIVGEYAAALGDFGPRRNRAPQDR